MTDFIKYLFTPFGTMWERTYVVSSDRDALKVATDSYPDCVAVLRREFNLQNGKRVTIRDDDIAIVSVVQRRVFWVPVLSESYALLTPCDEG